MVKVVLEAIFALLRRIGYDYAVLDLTKVSVHEGEARRSIPLSRSKRQALQQISEARLKTRKHLKTIIYSLKILARWLHE